jgi:hypothetical protein
MGQRGSSSQENERDGPNGKRGNGLREAGPRVRRGLPSAVLRRNDVAAFDVYTSCEEFESLIFVADKHQLYTSQSSKFSKLPYPNISLSAILFIRSTMSALIRT